MLLGTWRLEAISACKGSLTYSIDDCMSYACTVSHINNGCFGCKRLNAINGLNMDVAKVDTHC